MLCVSIFGVIVSAILLSTVTDVQSRYVQHPEIHRSVLHKKVVATWDEAKRRCEAEGAVIASPLDEEMLEYMRSSIDINNHTTPYFIGFRATGNSEVIFSSVEGVTLDDLPEAAMNMIDHLDPEDGDCLAMGRHNIQGVSCRARLPYMCYKNYTSTSTSRAAVSDSVVVTTEPQRRFRRTTETDDGCRQGYRYVSGSYYKLHRGLTMWDDAQRICSDEGGFLAVINNETEAKAVTEFINSKGWGWQMIYIGIRDFEKNGHWQSVLGHSLDNIYNKWSKRHTDVNECGTIDSDGLLDDVNCSSEITFICEKLYIDNC